MYVYVVPFLLMIEKENLVQPMKNFFSIENLLLQLVFLLDTENWGASLKTTQHMNGRPLSFSSEWLSLLFVL